MQPLTNLRLAVLEKCLSAIDRLAARRPSRDNRPAHLVTGERGEDAAFLYLRRRGFVIVAQRWNDGPLPGDVDLIAWDGDVLCFVEVKTRTSKSVATASSAVDRPKRETLRKLASQYLRQLPGGDQFETRPESRFDIVTVYELPGEPRVVQLIPGAMGWSERRRQRD